MVRFLSNVQLYQTIVEKSAQTKETLFVSTTSLGLNAHKVFSQEVVKNPPADIRFLVCLNEFTVKQSEVNPYEIQYLEEHCKGINIKSCDNFHTNIYIFDESALITSAALTIAAFETNVEAGVLLEGAEAEQAKVFYNDLWSAAKPLGDLRKYKLLWNLAQKSAKKEMKKVKPRIEIKDWADFNGNTWFIGVSRGIPGKVERKIKKETNWPSNLSVIGDIGYSAFLQLKLADLAYIADTSKRGKVDIVLARIIDKARVETDEGDYHAAFEAQKTYQLQREPFFDMLKNAGIKSKTSETILSSDQYNQVVLALASIKRKRKHKTAK